MMLIVVMQNFSIKSYMYNMHVHVYMYIIFIYFSKPLRLLYSLIVYEIVNFLSSLFTLCYFFLSFYI